VLGITAFAGFDSSSFAAARKGPDILPDLRRASIELMKRTTEVQADAVRLPAPPDR
jgi:hypothetical protein